jgi:predicted secreted protein
MTMKRSRRIALVSHCLLNVNAKVEGLAEYQGVHPVIEGLSAAGFGVIQLPCLEMTHMGMKRWA